MQAETTTKNAGWDRDGLFETLADRRRRVVGVLRTAGEQLTLTELAEELAGDTASSGNDVERIRIGLYHRHLPRLAETGLVEFDPEDRTAMLSGTVPEAAVARTERSLEIE